MPNVTNIPAPRADFIDPRTGLLSREWYRFFLNLFNLTGAGTSDTSLVDVQVGPPVYDTSGDIRALEQQAELSSLLAIAIPQSDKIAKYNRTLQWLTMGH